MENEGKPGKSKRGQRQAKRAKRDFSAAKALFAEGQLSMRAIGRRCGIPERTLRHHAKAQGWAQLPPGKQLPDQEKVGEIPYPLGGQQPHDKGIGEVQSGQNAPIDPAAIADRGRDLVGRMLSELEAITAHSGELRAVILDATKDDGDGRRRARLSRMLDLSSRAVVLKDLATAARTLGDAQQPVAAGGKKQEAKGKATRIAAAGRFATPPPPKLVINNSDGRR
jgi:hypothetical protein